MREGYKQTEVGVIPEDWGIKSYDDSFSFLSTATYSRSQLSEHENVQYLHYGDIHTKYDYHLDFSKHKLPSISSELVKNYSLLKEGDIVMADASEDYLGICKSIEVLNINEKKAIAGLHTFLLRDKNETFVEGFRGYLSSSGILKQQFDQYATGMKVYGVSKVNLKKILIPIPPKTEQKAIAKALSDIDALIESLEQLIEKKRHVKQGAMQELLTGKKRLDAFDDEWVNKKLVQVCEITMGQSPSSSAYNSEGLGLPLVQGNADIKNRKTIIRNYTNEITKRSFTGDIIMSVRAPVGEIARAVFDSCIGRGVCAIKANDFLYHYLIFIEPNWAKMSTGSTFDSVNSTEIKELDIFIPRLEEEQEAIATILSDMDLEIEALEKKLAKAKQLKDGMMHELLTGRIRLV